MNNEEESLENLGPTRPERRRKSVSDLPNEFVYMVSATEIWSESKKNKTYFGLK